MMSTVVGGAMLPHALSSSRCRILRTRSSSRTCARWRPTLASACGRSTPDPLDHLLRPRFYAPSSFFHNAATALHGSCRRRGEWRLRGPQVSLESCRAKSDFELVRQLYRQNFDPAFTSTAKIDYAIGIPSHAYRPYRAGCCRSS